MFTFLHRLSLRDKLMVEFIGVVIVLLIGMVTFRHIEGWSYLDAFYFASTTMAAVGYGDFFPRTDLGKIITIFYQFTSVPIFVYTTSILIEYRLRRVNNRHKMVPKILLRESRSAATYSIQALDGTSYELSREDLHERLGVDGVIRIHQSEYESIPADLFRHINLAPSRHSAGKKYALARIIRPGSFFSGQDAQPLLSFDNIVICECTHTKENIMLDEISDHDLRHSLPHARNIEDLELTLVKRYAKMLDISADEITHLPVSFTDLKVLATTSLTDKA